MAREVLGPVMRLLVLLLIIPCCPLNAQSIDLPPRRSDARTGSAVLDAVKDLDLVAREGVLLSEILEGNVPSFLRSFVTVEMTVTFDGRDRLVRLGVLPDVIAIGSNEDFVRVPLSPRAAQIIADRTRTSLPTSKISDAVWAAADLRMLPQPIPPSEAMTTIPVFASHHSLIEALWPSGIPSGVLVAGIKKDVVLTPRLADDSDHVAIYGWHEQDGSPIQPLYTGHVDDWVDYSHGIRLVSRRVVIDGVEQDLHDLLQDSSRWRLVSDEGPMRAPRYPTGPR